MTALQCAGVESPEVRSAVRIADARAQTRVTLAGTIRATETVTAGAGPAYRCVLADGTGEADLLFLGRPVVGGLTAGTYCRAEGMATVRSGRLAVWNPRYQAGPSPRSGRVLVVDDQKSMRRVLELSLTAHGYAVDGAATGRSALELARQRRPDLIILDLGLPDMDGLQVIAGVRAFSAVPILVISARDAGMAEARAEAAGADDYLAKPFEIGDLLGRVRAALPPAVAGERSAGTARRLRNRGTMMA
jgi:CheY-like chemotaxis protein